MMMPNNNKIQAQEATGIVATAPVETDQRPVITTATQRLQKIARQLAHPVLADIQPLSSFHVEQQAPCTLLVLGRTPNQASNKHSAKLQDNQLICQLQTQVEEVAKGLQQLHCTQQLEAETVQLFSKMQKAFQSKNTTLFQRHWNSWLQVIELLEQQTTTLYGTSQPEDKATFFTPYGLPSWLFEKAVPEAKEAIDCYEQFWLSQQQETNTRHENAQFYSNQVQIKLENWLAAKTAPKSN